MGTFKDLAQVIQGMSPIMLVEQLEQKLLKQARVHLDEKDWWKAARMCHGTDLVREARKILSGEVTPIGIEETIEQLKTGLVEQEEGKSEVDENCESLETP